MTKQEAIELLNPDTSAEAIRKIKYKYGFAAPNKVKNEADEAGRIACECIRESAGRQWHETDTKPEDDWPVLVTVLDTCENTVEVRTATYSPENGWAIDDVHPPASSIVTAWMEMPEPHTGDVKG